MGRLRDRLAAQELGVLGLVLVAAVIMLAFFHLADEVVEGDTHAFDSAVLLSLRNHADLADPVGPAWLEWAARDITSLGGYPVVILTTLSAIGFLLIIGKRHAALLVLASIGGGMLLSSGLNLFERPRPDLVPHVVQVYTLSFPSGHAMLSAATYLTLGALLARVQPKRVVETLSARRCHPADAADRCQSGLSRRALADRRAGRLVRRRRVGDALLDNRAVAAAPRQGGGAR